MDNKGNRKMDNPYPEWVQNPIFGNLTENPEWTRWQERRQFAEWLRAKTVQDECHEWITELAAEYCGLRDLGTLPDKTADDNHE